MQLKWRLHHRNINIKSSSIVDNAFCGNMARMVLDDFFNDRKPDSGAVVFCTRMQPLKKFKYFFVVFLRKSNAIIFNADVAIIMIGQ